MSAPYLACGARGDTNRLIKIFFGGVGGFFWRARWYSYGMSLSDRDGLIWYDGAMVPWREATVHVLAHTLHYGTGVFEGVRCYATDNGPAIFRLQDHSRRLLQSAHIIQMPIPFTERDLSAAQCQAIAANNLQSGYIRPLAFYGANTLGLAARDNPVHVIVAAWQWGTYLGEEALQNGIRVKVSSFSRMHINANMCLAKVSGHYINSVMANAEVTRHGYDEALLLNTQGLLAEGAGENLFVIKDGAVITPPLTSVLAGITRDALITLAADLGIAVIERELTRDALYCADEAFFTGTAAEVTPIAEVDDRPIGNGKRGEVTAALQKSFFDTVQGRGKRSPEWLTAVSDFA